MKEFDWRRRPGYLGDGFKVLAVFLGYIAGFYKIFVGLSGIF